MLNRFEAFIRGPKILLQAWLRHQEVSYRNSEAYISFPTTFQYDDINAIKLMSDVIIDPYSMIVVRSNSPYSSILGRLTVAERSIIGSHANIRAAGGEIYIGKNALIAQHVSLIASGHLMSLEQPYRDLPWDQSKVGISIEENVWIGANATVLPGCNIGRNSIIGAGSVVTKTVSANEVWAGVPARKLKNIETQPTGVMVL